MSQLLSGTTRLKAFRNPGIRTWAGVIAALVFGLLGASGLRALAVERAAAPEFPDLVELVGGKWWNGETFIEENRFMKDGVFVMAPGEQPTRRQELGGRYVVPPFADAHHHVTNPTEEGSRGFLGSGIFYVRNLNNLSTSARKAREFFGRPDTVDVREAMGGITAPGGHPEKLYQVILSRYLYRGFTHEDFLGNAYHEATSPAEANAALDTLEEQGADLVKIYLLYSEEFDRRRSDPAHFGSKGLDPSIVRGLVKSAHERGFQVVAHVETAADFRAAVVGGVDELAHLPGYRGFRLQEKPHSFRLSREDAALAAEAGIAAATTYHLVEALLRSDRPAAHKEEALDIQRSNLHLLQEAGVPLLIGSDGRGDSAIDETIHLVEIGALKPAEVLAAFQATAQAIFPDRIVGCFDPGCEASFVTLTQDPTETVSALRSIENLVKEGRVLEP